MQVTIRPIRDPGQEIDITRCLVASIAEELWRRYRGNSTLNWVEAEAHLRAIFDRVRQEAVNEYRAAMRPCGVADGERTALSANGQRTPRRAGRFRSGHGVTPVVTRQGTSNGTGLPSNGAGSAPTSRPGGQEPHSNKRDLERVGSGG